MIVTVPDDLPAGVRFAKQTGSAPTAADTFTVMPLPDSSSEEPCGPASRSVVLKTLEDLIADGHGALVIVAKVEGMKSLNHVHGIRFGDELLRVIGARIETLAPASGHVGTLSGDVFLVVSRAGKVDDVAETVGEAAAGWSRPVRVGDVAVRPRFKIGIAHAAPGRGDVDQLMVEASAAMRAASASTYSDIVTVDDQIRSRAHTETVIDRDIEEALSSGALSFAYQPVVTLNDSVIHGAEALVRWEHPEVGFVNPALLVERIDAMGLTRRFTRWSVDRVTSEWADMLNENDALHGVSVSMNFNETQLADRECAAMVHDAVRTSRLRPDGLIVEVVESGRIGELAEATLRALAAAGSVIVLDDFGTGFNALEYFLRFPVHGIKFDRSLTHSIATNDTSAVIVAGVADMAKKLGVVTVGEGIETVDDANMCRDLRLTFGQGWHFGRPVPLADFLPLALASRSGVAAALLDRGHFN